MRVCKDQILGQIADLRPQNDDCEQLLTDAKSSEFSFRVVVDNDRRRNARHIWFLNTAFDNLDFETAKKRLVERDPSAPFAYMVTPNVDHLVRMRRDSAFSPLYAQAWMTLCDSRVLELMAGVSDQPVNVAPGSDLTGELFETEIKPHEPVVIIGGDQQVIDGMKIRYGLTNIRWYSPPMGLRNKPEEIAKCASFIACNPARFYFLCVGSPQQEMIAAACLDRGDCTGIGLCVGASLDFLSGKTQRAPIWMRNLRLEWLHRLCDSPHRMWKRYLVDGPKVAYLYWEWRKARQKLRAFESEFSKISF